MGLTGQPPGGERGEWAWAQGRHGQAESGFAVGLEELGMRSECSTSRDVLDKQHPVSLPPFPPLWGGRPSCTKHPSCYRTGN